MKTVTMLLLLLLASPAFSELTKEDIRTIVKEEVTASEKRTREYIDLKIDALDTRIDAVDKKLDWVWYMMIALIGLITAAIAIPQIVVAYRDRGQKDMQTEIQRLRERLEALENTPS